MREILFRGKRKDNGEWIEGFYFQKRNPMSEDGLPIYHGISDLPPFGAEVDPETVGQYTGLTDKNGKKIFEGDIVRRFVNGTELKGVVQHVDGAFGARFADGAGQFICFFENGEVISNIHDNPELMKGGAE